MKGTVKPMHLRDSSSYLNEKKVSARVNMRSFESVFSLGFCNVRKSLHHHGLMVLNSSFTSKYLHFSSLRSL